jgi:hypothetical protein
MAANTTAAEGMLIAAPERASMCFSPNREVTSAMPKHSALSAERRKAPVAAPDPGP